LQINQAESTCFVQLAHHRSYICIDIYYIWKWWAPKLIISSPNAVTRLKLLKIPSPAPQSFWKSCWPLRFWLLTGEKQACGFSGGLKLLRVPWKWKCSCEKTERPPAHSYYPGIRIRIFINFHLLIWDRMSKVWSVECEVWSRESGTRIS